MHCQRRSFSVDDLTASDSGEERVIVAAHTAVAEAGEGAAVTGCAMVSRLYPKGSSRTLLCKWSL